MTGAELKLKVSGLDTSYAQVAAKLEIIPQQLQRIFKSEDIKTGILEKLCEVYDIRMSYFYPNTEEPESVPKKVNNESVTATEAQNSSINTDAEIIRQVLSQNARLLDLLTKTR